MILQQQRAGFGRFGEQVAAGDALEFRAIVDEDAVVKHGQRRGGSSRARIVKASSAEDDVIRLPLARGGARR